MKMDQKKKTQNVKDGKDNFEVKKLEEEYLYFVEQLYKEVMRISKNNQSILEDYYEKMVQLCNSRDTKSIILKRSKRTHFDCIDYIINLNSSYKDNSRYI